MVNVIIRDREKEAGERARIRGEITFGYRETLYPKDVELKTIDMLYLQWKARSDPSYSSAYAPVGSVSSPGIIGNYVEIAWDNYMGSPEPGSRTAYFVVIGG